VGTAVCGVGWESEATKVRAVTAGWVWFLVAAGANGGGGFAPAIAVNSRQIKDWANVGKKAGRFMEEVINARCIYHEVGHIRLHNHLINPPAPGGAQVLAPHSTPLDEEQAWVFAFVVIGMMLGDYAEFQRLYHNRDDSPARIV
jgi:hypothetical protein